MAHRATRHAIGTRSLCDPVAMMGSSRSAGAGRDALPRVRRCTSRGSFLLLLRTRSCAIGAEALSYRFNEVFPFLGRAMPDRAGARPYHCVSPDRAGVQLGVRRRIARQASLPSQQQRPACRSTLPPESAWKRLRFLSSTSIKLQTGNQRSKRLSRVDSGMEFAPPSSGSRTVAIFGK